METTQRIEQDTNRDEPIEAHRTTVRYAGSHPQFHGLYGWVEDIYTLDGETRYDIALSVGPYCPVQRLYRVRRQSLVVGENLG